MEGSKVLILLYLEIKKILVYLFLLVYYRVEDMTIYASYFGFGNTSEINLDMFKEETEKA